MMQKTYTYIILCGETQAISSLGFSTAEKAIDWLITERSVNKIRGWTAWCNDYIYKIKAIEVI